MTAVQVQRPSDIASDPAPPRSWARISSFAARHRRSLVIVVPLLALVGLANGWNLQGWPGRVNDDEGTYVSEAWAVIVPHHLSQYTYWYDHPPLGWALMAANIWITHGFERYPSAVMAGREFMWVVNLASCGLLYLLSRRVRMARSFAAVAVLIFGLSPLSIYFHRMVFLDNIATMWMLAALVLAASPRRSLVAAVASGACFALACLSKETIAVTLPALCWLLWQNCGRKTRLWNMSIFGAAFVLIIAGYPLFAALRGELLPGPGHVSLVHALVWQLASRPGSGGLLSPHSATFSLARSWVALDPYSLLGGAVLTPIAFLVRRLRPMAMGFGIQAALLLKNGYVPYMYVTAMLPFGALLIAGLMDSWWQPAAPALHIRLGLRVKVLRHAGVVPVMAVLMAFVIVAAPQWVNTLVAQSHIDGDAGSLAATAWINSTLKRGELVVVDDYVWPDVTMHGKATPLWCWKVNGDPWVRRHLLPDGYKSIDYIVLPVDSSCALNPQQLPTLVKAIAHSRVVKRFADGLVARKVTGR
jgi:hypothetical protein